MTPWMQAYTRRALHQRALQCSRSSIAGPDGTEKVVVNVRCLDGVELGALQVQSFDGKSY